MTQSQRQRKTKDPCVGCSLHKSRCICEFISQISLKTKVSLIIHAKELKRTTNTGTLALKCLANSDVFVRGQDQKPLDLSSLLSAEYDTLLFYPTENATELTTEYIAKFNRPIQLIVPDGNWRQASKVHYRHPELATIPRVMINTPNLASAHLRNENTEYGMATLEAIAFALGIIEGRSIQNHLMQVYYKKLEQTLLGRGQKVTILKDQNARQ